VNVGTLTTILDLKDELSGKMAGPISALTAFSTKVLAATAVAYELTSALKESVTAAKAYEAQIAKIDALTNATRATTEAWKYQLLELSATAGRAPRELADALYFVASSGHFAAAGIEVTESAAKAAALGMGDTAVIARALVSVMNAYGKENMTAAKTMDILTQSIIEGNVEANELAPSIGRVAGVAAAFGISLEEVGAYLATFTRVIPRAEEGVTSLRQLILNLESPSRQAADAIANLGLSTEDLRRAIREQGLMKTLSELIDLTKGNIEELDKIIPNVRAFAGFMATAASQGDTYAESLYRIQAANGVVDKGMERMGETFDFQWRRAVEATEAAKTRIGLIIEPLAAKITKFGADFMETMLRLSMGQVDLSFQGGMAFALPDFDAMTAQFETFTRDWDAWFAGLGENQRQQESLAAAFGITGQFADYAAQAVKGMLAEIARDRSTKEARAEQERYNKALRDLTLELSGGKADAALKMLQEAWGRLTPAQQESSRSIATLTEKYGALREKLAELPPVFEAFWAAMKGEPAGPPASMIQDWTDSIADANKKFQEQSKWLSQLSRDAEEWQLEQEALEAAEALKWINEELERMHSAVTFVDSLEAAFAKLPNAIYQVLKGGGDLGQTIGALFGKEIFGPNTKLTQGIGEFFEYSLGPKIGGFISSMIPGIGTLLGAGLSGVFNKLFGGKAEHMKVNDLRDAFVAAAGGITELDKRAQKAGLTLDRLLNAKKVKDYEAAVRELQEAFELQDRAVELLNAAVEKYGFEVGELGPILEAQRMDEKFAELLQDYQLLINAGIDQETVVKRMAPAFNEMLWAAMKTGQGIPEQFRPILQMMIDMGLLTDEAGNKIESLDGIDFTTDLRTGLKDAIAAIDRLINALRQLYGLPPINIPVNVGSGSGAGSGGKNKDKDDTDDTKAAQSGYYGWVSHPTQFNVAEAGPEFVDITPAGRARGKGVPSEDLVVHVHLSLPGEPILHFVQRATKRNEVWIHPNSVRPF
jgi:TP901 family phage tail tape measure protein